MFSKILKYFSKNNSNAISYIRGHEVLFDNGDFGDKRYVDTGEEVKNHRERPCKRCGKLPTLEGHDACLGELPGVKYACCGHGVSEGYILFKNSIQINGYFKVEKVEDNGEEIFNQLWLKKDYEQYKN